MDRTFALKGMWRSTQCPRVLCRARETGRGNTHNGSGIKQEKMAVRSLHGQGKHLPLLLLPDSEIPARGPGAGGLMAPAGLVV